VPHCRAKALFDDYLTIRTVVVRTFFSVPDPSYLLTTILGLQRMLSALLALLSAAWDQNYKLFPSVRKGDSAVFDVRPGAVKKLSAKIVWELSKTVIKLSKSVTYEQLFSN